MTPHRCYTVRLTATLSALALAVVGSGCAVVNVVGAAAGAAVSVGGAVVSTTISTGGKVVGAVIDAAAGSDDEGRKPGKSD